MVELNNIIVTFLAVMLVGTINLFVPFYPFGFVSVLIIPLSIFVFWIHMQRKFPITCRIIEKRGGGGRVEFNDRLGRETSKKTGRSYVVLKKRKNVISDVNYSDLMRSNKGGNVIYLYATAPDDITPVKYTVVKFGTEEGDEDILKIQEDRAREIARKQIYIAQNEVIVDKFTEKTFMERYMPLILLILFALSVSFIMIAANQGLTENIGRLASSVSELGRAADTIQQASGSISGASQQLAKPVI